MLHKCRLCRVVCECKCLTCVASSIFSIVGVLSRLSTASIPVSIRRVWFLFDVSATSSLERVHSYCAFFRVPSCRFAQTSTPHLDRLSVSMEQEGYAKTTLNTVVRYKNRGLSCCPLLYTLLSSAQPRDHSSVHSDTSLRFSSAAYDYGTIHAIINHTPILHVSFSPPHSDPFPTTLPMIGQMGLYPSPSAEDDDIALDQPLDCYLHGYISSRLMRLASTRSPDDVESPQGLPICIAATQLDGIVLSLTPNSHSYNYRSAILHGYALPVEDVDEKLYAMRLITNSVVPSRWEHTRSPPDKTEMTSTQILKVRIVTGSAKVRRGGPGDERKDMRREDILDRVWTGVVPVWGSYGEPVPSSYNRVEHVPDHVRAFVDAKNDKGRGEAEEAASAESVSKRLKKSED